MMPDMNGRLRKLVVATAVGAAALSFAGCSAEVSLGDKTINSSDLEAQLADQLSAQADVDPSKVSVDCPDDQKVEKGAKFTCDLTAPNGDDVTVDVTLTDDDGNYDATVPK